MKLRKTDIMAFIGAALTGIGAGLSAFGIVTNIDAKKERDKEEMKDWVRNFISSYNETDD